MSRSYVPSSNVSALRESATLAVAARAKALKASGRPVIDLGVGEPDFDTPAFIRHAAAAAMEQPGAGRYTATEGILPLREAIAAEVGTRYGGDPPIAAGEIVVSAGTKQALFNACFVLFGAGDEVLVPTPAWTSYYEMVSLARATAVPVRGRRERDFKVTAAELEAAATPRTKGLILNSPCNPTGAVYSAAELRALLELADRRDWWVISDEIYRRLAYGRVAPSVLELVSRRDRLVVVDGMAKAYAMPGWRVGWAVAPRPVAQMMSALQSHSTSGASAPAQHAALAALRQRDASDAAIAAMVADLDRRRRGAVALLRDAGDVEFVEPAGALFLFIRVGVQRSATDDPSASFATRLLDEQNVAVVPGAAFLTPEWVRASFAAPESEVLAGLGRLVHQLHAARPAGGAAAGRAGSLV